MSLLKQCLITLKIGTIEMTKSPKIESKKQQKYHAKTLTDVFAQIKRGQEYVTVVMQRDSWEALQYAINIAFREEDMATKKKIVGPAVKEKSGKIDKAPSVAWAHDDLEAAKNLKKSKVKEGFETNTGEFVTRKKAAKIAEKAGEIKHKVKKLHTTDLRRSLKVKEVKAK